MKLSVTQFDLSPKCLNVRFFLQQTQTHWHSVILKHVISFMSFWICMVGIIFNENLWYKGQNLWWSILMKVGNVSILTKKYYNWYNSSIIKINKVFNIFFQLNCFFLNKYLYSYENILPNWCYLYVFRKAGARLQMQDLSAVFKTNWRHWAALGIWCCRLLDTSPVSIFNSITCIWYCVIHVFEQQKKKHLYKSYSYLNQLYIQIIT